MKKKGFAGLVLLLVALLFALYFNQWVTLEKLSNMINPLAQFGTFADFFKFLGQYGSRIFDGTDFFFFVLIVLICVGLVWMEFRKGRLTDLAEALPHSDGHIVLYLVIIALFCMRYYFALGHDTYTGDAPYYYYLVSQMTESFKQGILFPYWTNLHGAGAPINQFYGPLHSYVAAVFNLLSGNIFLSVKLSLFLFHLLSAVGVFLFIRELFNSRKAGFIAGLATILMYYHPHMIIFPGRYGEGSIWAVYPFLFLFFERYIRLGKFTDIVLLALSTAALVLTSIGMSFYFFLFWGVYAGMRLLLLDATWKRKFSILFMISIGILSGFLLCSYYLYSQIFESKWSVAEIFSSSKSGQREPHLVPPMLVWNNFQIILFDVPRVWQSAYFGITLLLLALAGMVESVRKWDRRILPFTMMAVLIVLFFIGYGRSELLMKIPYLHTYTQARLLNIMAFSTIFLAGAGVLALLKWIPRRGLFMGVVLLIAIDFFPTTFHDTWGAQYAGTATPFFDKLKSEYGSHGAKLADFRMELMGGQNNRAVNNNWRTMDAFLSETRVPLVRESIWDYHPINVFFDSLDQLVYSRDPRMTIDILLNHYALFNCRYLLSTFALPQQAFKSYEVSSDVVLAEFKFVTPVLFTYKLEKVDFNTNMYISYVAGLRIDSARRTVSHMWLKNGETAELPAQQQAPELLSHQVFNTKAVMKVRLAGKAFAVLSYSAYPTIRLFVDGKAAKYWETAQGTICIPLEPGEHEIIIKAGRSGMALLCCSVSGFLFVLMMVYLFLVYRKNKKAKELK